MQKELCFDASIERFLYKFKRRPTPHHTTQPKEAILGEQLANAMGPLLSPQSHLNFDRVEQGGHWKLSVVEYGYVAMLLDPPCSEHDHRRGALAQQGVARSVVAHQSRKPSPATGRVKADCIHDSTSCQIIQVNGQSVRMCGNISSDWSHNLNKHLPSPIVCFVPLSIIFVAVGNNPLKIVTMYMVQHLGVPVPVPVKTYA
jgi:hypothetical protein